METRTIDFKIISQTRYHLSHRGPQQISRVTLHISWGDVKAYTAVAAAVLLCRLQLYLPAKKILADTRSKCNLQIFCKLFVMKNCFLASTL